MLDGGAQPARVRRAAALPLDARGAVAQAHGDGALLSPVHHAHLDRVPWLPGADRRDDIAHRADRLAVDRRDDVAARMDPGTIDGHRGVWISTLDAGLVGGSVRRDALDQCALLDREVEDVRNLRR